MRIFHKIIVSILIPTLFFSCKKEYPQADAMLAQARSLYASGNYAEAQKAINSIAKVAPKAFPQINAGLELLDSVRYGENIQIVTQSDSLLKEVESDIERQKALFTYEINSTYQDKGNYFPKVYPGSLLQMGLRAGVEADGELFLESISNRALKHSSVKVSASNGIFAETKTVTDDGANYHFQTAGKMVEVVHYSGKRENGMAAFIVANRNKNLTITLRGKSSASFTLSEQAKKGIADSYILSNLFSRRDSLRFQAEKSKQLIKYLDSREAKKIATKAQKQLK